MAVWFIRVAVAYVVIGVIFGFVIGIQEKFAFANVHAHLNLVGWATLALAGVIYFLFPAAGNNRLAVVHFWLQNIGLPVFTIGLFLIDAGNVQAGVPPTAIGSLIVIAAILVFAINVWTNVKTVRA